MYLKRERGARVNREGRKMARRCACTLAVPGPCCLGLHETPASGAQGDTCRLAGCRRHKATQRNMHKDAGMELWLCQALLFRLQASKHAEMEVARRCKKTAPSAAGGLAQQQPLGQPATGNKQQVAPQEWQWLPKIGESSGTLGRRRTEIWPHQVLPPGPEPSRMPLGGPPLWKSGTTGVAMAAGHTEQLTRCCPPGRSPAGCP